MDVLVGLSSDVGLYAGEVEPVSRAFLGSISHGLSHPALVSAALALPAEIQQ